MYSVRLPPSSLPIRASYIAPPSFGLPQQPSRLHRAQSSMDFSTPSMTYHVVPPT